jgi:hypothetical protein
VHQQFDSLSSLKDVYDKVRQTKMSVEQLEKWMNERKAMDPSRVVCEDLSRALFGAQTVCVAGSTEL